MLKKPKLSREDAEIIGLQVLAFIASDPALLERFAATTGISGDDLRQRAGSAEILSACLGEILKNEPDLLMFCANANIAPEHINLAQTILEDLPQAEQ